MKLIELFEDAWGNISKRIRKTTAVTLDIESWSLILFLLSHGHCSHPLGAQHTCCSGNPELSMRSLALVSL